MEDDNRPGGSPFDRSEVVLAAMAAGGVGTLFEPVRIQKLLFLIDREVPDAVGGPHFDFRPYHYGPFDRAVYDTLDTLSETGQVRIRKKPGHRTYSLTASGLEGGKTVLMRLPAEIRRYFIEAARAVLSLGFARLLAAIYDRYPEMAENSVALEVVRRHSRSAFRFPARSFLGGMATAFGDFDEVEEIGPLPAEFGGRTDAEALAADWRAIGDDLRAAMAIFATETMERG